MATTTNYNWATPDDTDLVKDGASAIRTLGSSADTTVKNLNPGTTAGDIDYYTSSTAKARIAIGTANQVLQVNSGATAPEWGVDPVADVITTAGDLIYGTAADTVARLGIGTAGQVLQVNSGATAPEWAAPAAGGGMTLLSTTTLSGTSTTISGISTAYKNLQIVVQLVSLSNAGTYNIQPNASATNCVFVGQYLFGPSTTGVQSSAGGAPAQSSNFLTSNTDNSFSMNIYDYASASNRKSFDFQGYYYNASNVYCAEQAHGGVKTTSAITSLKLEASLGYSFNSGTVLLYGVS